MSDPNDAVAKVIVGHARQNGLTAAQLGVLTETEWADLTRDAGTPDASAAEQARAVELLASLEAGW